MNIACIIPAHNEASRILGVLRPVVESQLFSQVIVVDDGSTDRTADVAQFSGCRRVEICRLSENMGKSFAVAHGLHTINCDYVCLLDADLSGLMIHNLMELTAPVRCHQADATLSRRTSYGGWWDRDVDIFTGERVVKTQLLVDLDLEHRSSFEMEVLINGALIDSGARISVVDWPNVNNPSKVSKYGTWQGVKRDFRMFQEMNKVGGPRTLMRQTRELKRLVV